MSDKKNHHRFWMVWSPEGRAPTYEHITKESAFAEAERLAEQNPNRDFFVLRAIGGRTASATIRDITVRGKCPESEIPF